MSDHCELCRIVKRVNERRDFLHEMCRSFDARSPADAQAVASVYVEGNFRAIDAGIAECRELAAQLPDAAAAIDTMISDLLEIRAGVERFEASRPEPCEDEQ